MEARNIFLLSSDIQVETHWALTQESVLSIHPEENILLLLQKKKKKIFQRSKFSLLFSSLLRCMNENSRCTSSFFFLLSKDGLKLVLVSVPDWSLFLRSYMGTKHPSGIHLLSGESSVAKIASWTQDFTARCGVHITVRTGARVS